MCYIQSNGPCSICGRIINPVIEGSDCATKPIYINTRCNICGEKSTLTDPCNCKKPPISFQDIAEHFEKVTIHNKPGVITTGTSTGNSLPEYTLEDLYDELGKLKWLGADDGWDKAIEAVREHIKVKL